MDHTVILQTFELECHVVIGLATVVNHVWQQTTKACN